MTPQVLQDEDEFFLISDGGERGLPGADGSPGGGSAYQYVTAAQALGGHRAVIINTSGLSDYADNTVFADRHRVIGITTGAVIAGAFAEIQIQGEVTEPTWAWTPNLPVFVSTNGLLTQTAPVNPATFSLIIGFATAATKMYVQLREPIVIL